MSECWRADPATRPTFSQLKVQLEKLLENLPSAKACRDVIYINTGLPEQSPDSTQDSGFPQADSDLDAGEASEPGSPGAEAALVAVDVHPSEPWAARYVGKEQLGGPVEEPYVPLLPCQALQPGSRWSQAGTLPVSERPRAESCGEDSEVPLGTV